MLVFDWQLEADFLHFVFERPLVNLVIISGHVADHDKSHHAHHLKMDLIRSNSKNGHHLNYLDVELYEEFQQTDEYWDLRSLEP